MPTAPQVVADALDWLYGFAARPHPDLGRRGAVCPFLETAMKNGRVSVSVVHIDTEADLRRLRTAAYDGLDRVERVVHAGEPPIAVLFVPVGADADLLVAAVRSVQAELREDAIGRGCMIGDFSADNTTPGVRNPQFRPLTSPAAILGVRPMVEADILFLGAPEIPPQQRLNGAEQWFRWFGGTAPAGLVEAYQQVRTEVSRDPLDAVSTGWPGRE